MKTTLDIHDELLSKAKALAAHEHSTLTALIEDGLRLRLRKPGRSASAKQPRLPIHRGKGGLIAGVDPTSNRSMFEAADGDS
ncbi:MAG: type II toxin-antitoxin system VapB family antitoxin [Burkholderiaceae bacterium]|nr:type II toxin-antitoxin system VapB family antitoxin [Burkholderiaceae bacterium]